MEKRTRVLVAAGKSSLAVVIPKPWLEYYNLKRGDKVQMITNGEVTIKPFLEEFKYETTES